MAQSGVSRSNANKRIRQEALRQWLSEKCTAQHLVDNIEKIEGLDSASETFSNDLSKLRTANEQRLKILDKYLPSIKPIELSGEDGESLKIDQTWVIKIAQ